MENKLHDLDSFPFLMTLILNGQILLPSLRIGQSLRSRFTPLGSTSVMTA